MALARALASCPPRALTAEDDNEVEIIQASILAVLVSSSTSAPLTMAPRKPSLSAQVEAERKGNSLITSLKP